MTVPYLPHQERLMCRCGTEVAIRRIGTTLALGHVSNPTYRRHAIRLLAPRSGAHPSDPPFAAGRAPEPGATPE